MSGMVNEAPAMWRQVVDEPGAYERNRNCDDPGGNGERNRVAGRGKRIGRSWIRAGTRLRPKSPRAEPSSHMAARVAGDAGDVSLSSAVSASTIAACDGVWPHLR